MFEVGLGKRVIGVQPNGHAMMGYGTWHNRARGAATDLFARALWIKSSAGGSAVLCCADLGYIPHAVRSEVVKRLSTALPDALDASGLVLTCTHTHSGPGGCGYEALYNVVTPGFVAEHFEQIVAAITDAICAAHAALKPAVLSHQKQAIEPDVPVAWNRSMAAFQANPDAPLLSDADTHRAMDRGMHLLSVHQNNQLTAVWSVFGVHATCVGHDNTLYCGDNKGYASEAVEVLLRTQGVEDPVAVFAQGTAGDVSPHFQGEGAQAKRAAIRGEAEFTYAKNNGLLQARHAMEMLAGEGATALNGKISSLLLYFDFADMHVPPEFAQGQAHAYTSEPCHGVSFFEGTEIDGPGLPKWLGAVARSVARQVRRARLKNPSGNEAERTYHRRLYAAQGAKDILLECGPKHVLGQPIRKLLIPGFVDPIVQSLKSQVHRGALDHSPMIPTVLPVQYVQIGHLGLICCPGEFTTLAGQRLQHSVRAQLDELLGDQSPEHLLLMTYCNDYMGYVTTPQEYALQRYEGGHTVFGQWTLGAFQTRFRTLLEVMHSGKAVPEKWLRTQPEPVPAQELALRSHIKPPGQAGLRSLLKRAKA